MKNSAILRTAKVGGFNKEDVLTYVDELNSKIDSLKSELDKAKAVKAEAGELENYKNEVERLKERLSETENKLSDVRTNADSVKIELQNENNQISVENTSLKEENRNLKNEIEALKYQLESAQNSSVNTVEVQSADTSEYENEISELKIQLKNARSQISEMSGEMTKLTADISDKAKKIEKLTLDNKELRLQTNSSGFSSDFDMGALFTEAQATAKKIVVEARMAADKLVRNAQSEADRITEEAKSKAEKLNAEAVGKAVMIEDDARKNAQSAVTAAEKLKTIFKTEIETLCKRFSDAMENIEVTAGRLNSEIEAVKSAVSENVEDFINGTELNDAVSAARISSPAAEPCTIQTQPEENNYIPEPSEEYSEEISNFINSDEISEYESDDTEPDEYSGIPYISEPDDDDSYICGQYTLDNDDSENTEKSRDEEIDDILSSFAIDPVSDDDEEPELSKRSQSLGFDLGDLAKLAAEAEKDI